MADEAVFTFTDARAAVGGEKALLAAGFAVRVMPRPSALGDGCGICLRVNREELAAAAALLLAAGTPAAGVYLRIRRGGTIEYTVVPETPA